MARFENGYIKWYRSAFFGDIGTNIHCLGLWVALLSMATWKETSIAWNGHRRVLPPGSVVFGLRELAKSLGCCKNTITRWLDYLEKSDRIVTDRGPLGTVVTILKWKDYQGREDESATTMGPQIGPLRSRSMDHPAPLIEEEKKERSEEGGMGETKKIILGKSKYVADEVTPTRETVDLCIEEWLATLNKFKAGRKNVSAQEELEITQAIARQKSYRAVQLALKGVRMQEKTPTFDPSKFLNLRKLLAPESIERLINLGIQGVHQEGRAS